MPTELKKNIMNEFSKNIENANALIVVHYHGLTVQDMLEFRRSAAESEVSIQVIKNRLVKRVVSDTKFEGISSYLSGPTACVFSCDPIAAAKVVDKYAKSNENLVIVGGVCDGDKMDVTQVKELAKMPSIEEARAHLVGLLQSVARNTLSVIRGPTAKLVRIVDNHVQQKDV